MNTKRADMMRMLHPKNVNRVTRSQRRASRFSYPGFCGGRQETARRKNDGQIKMVGK